MRAIYLLAVQRAGQEGVAREPVETPLEFVAELEEQWPEAEEALEDLTAAFLKARYSDQPITADDLPPGETNLANGPARNAGEETGTTGGRGR